MPLVPMPPILGHITSDNPQVRALLPQIMIKMELPTTNICKQATAAAASDAQLSRVIEEMKAEPESKLHKSRDKITPLSVCLIRLSEHTIQNYTKKVVLALNQSPISMIHQHSTVKQQKPT